MRKRVKTNLPASDRDAMRPEYDFSKGVRGATAARYAQGTNVVVGEDDPLTHVPIVCTLGSAERRLRREEVFRALFAKIEETKALENGYAYRFAPREGLIAEIARLIELERGCCAFLSFDLRVTAGGGPVWLTLTGPPGAKEFLETEILPTAP